jgi:transcriptional regulator with XRE-family HTH domain
MKFKREFLKQKREEKKFNLRELSEKSGVSQSYIHILENEEETKVSAIKLYKLAKALDVRMESFFEKVEEGTKNRYYITWKNPSRFGSFQWNTPRNICVKMLDEAREWAENEFKITDILITNIIKLEQ